MAMIAVRHTPDLVLASTLLVTPGVAVAQAAAAPSGEVSFSAVEIAVITALLGAVVASLALVFRLLLASKDATIAGVQAQNAALAEQLQQQIKEPVTLLTGALRTNETAVTRAADLMQRLAERVQESADVGSAEHGQMLSALQTFQHRLEEPAPAAAPRRRAAARAPKGAAA